VAGSLKYLRMKAQLKIIVARQIQTIILKNPDFTEQILITQTRKVFF